MVWTIQEHFYLVPAFVVAGLAAYGAHRDALTQNLRVATFFVLRGWVWAWTTGSSKTGSITNGNAGQDCFSA